MSLGLRSTLLSLLLLALLLGIYHVATAPSGGSVTGGGANDEYAKLMGKAAGATKSDGMPTLSQMGEAALKHLPARLIAAPAPGSRAAVDIAAPLRVLDLGTGSGIIAITLALARSDLCLTATDASAQALVCAQANAERLSAPPIDWYQGDWWAALPPGTPRFDMVVSNPPYLADDDPHLDDPALRHEPTGALACGPQGLEAIEQIVTPILAHLLPGGWLLLEHGFKQGLDVRDRLTQAGLSEVVTLADLQGLDRVRLGRRPCIPV